MGRILLLLLKPQECRREPIRTPQGYKLHLLVSSAHIAHGAALRMLIRHHLQSVCGGKSVSIYSKRMSRLVFLIVFRICGIVPEFHGNPNLGPSIPFNHLPDVFTTIGGDCIESHVQIGLATRKWFVEQVSKLYLFGMEPSSQLPVMSFGIVEQILSILNCLVDASFLKNSILIHTGDCFWCSYHCPTSQNFIVFVLLLCDTLIELLNIYCYLNLMIIYIKKKYKKN